jgi:hypothetical protein
VQVVLVWVGWVQAVVLLNGLNGRKPSTMMSIGARCSVVVELMMLEDAVGARTCSLEVSLYAIQAHNS